MTLWYQKHHFGTALLFGDHVTENRRLYVSFTMQPGYTDLQPESIWAIDLWDVQFKNETIKESGINLAILDTDQPAIWLPRSDFALFADEISKIENITCNETYCLSMHNHCVDLCVPYIYDPEEPYDTSIYMANLTLVIDGVPFILPCAAFTESNITSYTDVMCDIKIDGSHDEYRLGIPFLESFTTTYVY